MAKAKRKSGPSKSENIRAALAANPDKPVAEIAKENGVTTGLVYTIKSKMKNPGAKKGRRGRKPGKKAATNGTAPGGVHNALDAAFEFIHKVGGVLHAEQLIAKLKSLKERL